MKRDVEMANLLSAVERLDEVLREPKSDIVRDSAVKRFELCTDLAWKLVKTHLAERHGIVSSSPKSCIREAFRQGLIDYDEGWLKLIDLRNEAVHIYNVAIAEKVYAQLPDALARYRLLADTIRRDT